MYIKRNVLFMKDNDFKSVAAKVRVADGQRSHLRIKRSCLGFLT